MSKYLLCLMALTLLKTSNALAIIGEAHLGAVQGDNSVGLFQGLSLKYNEKRHTAIGGYRKEQRVFQDNGKFSDQVFFLDYYYKINKKSYLETMASYSSDPSFNPEVAYSGAYHYLFKNFDFWGGLKSLHYPQENYLQARIGGLVELKERVELGAQFFAVNSSPTSNSIHLFAKKDYNKSNFRVDFASGKTIEAEDLVGNFNSYALESFLKYNTKLLGVALMFYDGELREEFRYSIIFKFKLTSVRR